MNDTGDSAGVHIIPVSSRLDKFMSALQADRALLYNN